MPENILQYESKVWSTADLLIGAGIKQSDFPKYMNLSIFSVSPRDFPASKTATKFHGLYFDVKVLNLVLLCFSSRFHGF